MPHTTPSRYARYLGPHTPPTIDPTLLTELTDAAREENKACARKVAHAARIWETCIEQTIHIGERITDAGNYAASETAAALGCSKTVADTYSDIGMDLRLRLPHIKAAFDAGDLDLPRVRAIHRVTAPYSTPPSNTHKPTSSPPHYTCPPDHSPPKSTPSCTAAHPRKRHNYAQTSPA